MIEKVSLKRQWTNLVQWELQIEVDGVYRQSFPTYFTGYELKSDIIRLLSGKYGKTGYAEACESIGHDVFYVMSNSTYDDSGLIDKFNAKWRAKCFKYLLETKGIRDKISYNEALQSLQEYFIIEPVVSE